MMRTGLDSRNVQVMVLCYLMERMAIVQNTKITIPWTFCLYLLIISTEWSNEVIKWNGMQTEDSYFPLQ